MPKYDLETRKAAIQRYKLTDYNVAVCKEFNISRVTLDAWIKLEEETGGLSPKAANNRGAPSHIKDWNEFQAFVKNTKFQNIRALKNKSIDYVFLGSSRVENVIMPNIIEKKTKKK